METEFIGAQMEVDSARCVMPEPEHTSNCGDASFSRLLLLYLYSSSIGTNTMNETRGRVRHG